MKAILLTWLLATTAASAPTAETWLERIEAKAGEIDTLEAKIDYTTVQGLLGDEQRRFGTLTYDSADCDTASPTRFAAHFNRLIIDGGMQMQNRAYIFDGVWLGERIEEDDRKIFIRRQLSEEDGDGAEDVMALGSGPFVLPLNLKKDAVLRKYEVELIDAADEDTAENAVQLRLIPRPGVEIDQERIDMWFDRESLLPVRIETINRDESESIVVLRDLELNGDVDADAFDTTPPQGGGWEIEVKPLESSEG